MLLAAAIYALGWFVGYQDAGRKQFDFFFPDDEEGEDNKERQNDLWRKVMPREPEAKKTEGFWHQDAAQAQDTEQAEKRQQALSEEEKREIKRRMKAVNDIASFGGPRAQKGGKGA